MQNRKKAPFRLAVKQYRSGYAALTILSPPYDTTELTHSTTTLDKSSYNPTSHKATSLRTLTRRAQLVCNTTDSLSDENKYLENNYNEDFIQCNTHRPATTTEANDNATPSTTATIPYTKGISENISHILQPFNNCVAHKPYTILQPITSRQNWPFDWQQLFTWIWGWLPLRLSKCQSPLPTTVLLRTTLTRTIKLHYYNTNSIQIHFLWLSRKWVNLFRKALIE